MATSVSRKQILNIYKSLIRESEKFALYNFRSYALRRVRDAFQENKNVADQNKRAELYTFAKENLEIIRRQVIVGHLYQSEKLVIENRKQNE